MKTLQLTTFFSFLAASCYSIDPPNHTELEDWLNSSYPIFYKENEAKYQYITNGTIRFLTVHMTGSGAGDETIGSEKSILRHSVHKAAIYQTETGIDQPYTVAKDSNGDPLPNLASTPYHYLIGNSGTIYKGRPNVIAPASATYYFSNTQITRGHRALNGSTTLSKPDHYAITRILQSAIDNWRQEIGQTAYEQWVKDQKQFLRNAEKSDSGVELTRRITKQKVRLAGPGYTQGHITVCFIGGKSLPTEKAQNSAARLILYLQDLYSIPNDHIRTHREVANTSCPGDSIHFWVRQRNGDPGPLFEKLQEFR